MNPDMTPRTQFSATRFLLYLPLSKKIAAVIRFALVSHTCPQFLTSNVKR
jgi:hypothetical protein